MPLSNLHTMRGPLPTVICTPFLEPYARVADVKRTLKLGMTTLIKGTVRGIEARAARGRIRRQKVISRDVMLAPKEGDGCAEWVKKVIARDGGRGRDIRYNKHLKMNREKVE